MAHGWDAEAATPFVQLRVDASGVGISKQHWWPDALNLRVLRQNDPKSDPVNRSQRSSTRRPVSCRLRLNRRPRPPGGRHLGQF